MKSKKKKILFGILTAVVLLVASAVIIIADLASFPGSIREAPFKNLVVAAGVKSSFHQGVVYRYPGFVPLLEVSGDSYEMGLQYGTLLRPEILAALESLKKFFEWQASKMHLPYFLLTAGAKFKTRQMAPRLPVRYREELKGVADGSGVPYDSVVLVSLVYDLYQSLMACTGVLLRGPAGSIIQGRLNDTTGFGEMAGMMVVVRHKPRGFNAVTHLDPPLYLGVETGFNDRGLVIAGETLRVQKPNPRGFSHPFLMRMILEEAASLEEIYPFFDRYPQVGSDGCVWSDQRRGRGAVVELTPWGWSKKELGGPILWDFNRFYDPDLAKQQTAAVNISRVNLDREALASAFPQKTEYSLQDAVDFVRNQTGPDGTDYSWEGTKMPVCNAATTQMMIFDSRSEGFYLAVGPSFASRRNICRVFSDFSRPPELSLPARAIQPLAERAAEIDNRLDSEADKLRSFRQLAERNREDANAQFLVAFKSFLYSKPEIFTQFAEKAFAQKPEVSDYRLFAGLAAYQKNDPAKAIALLEAMKARYPEQDLFRLTILERSWAGKDPRIAARYRTQRQGLLDRHGATSFFNKKLLPLLNALDPKK